MPHAILSPEALLSSLPAAHPTQTAPGHVEWQGEGASHGLSALILWGSGL